jgi:hypothetical protein
VFANSVAVVNGTSASCRAVKTSSRHQPVLTFAVLFAQYGCCNFQISLGV